MTKAKDTAERERVWQKTAVQNLFRHNPSGTFYLRVRIGRKNAKRECLKTDNFQIAKARSATRLAALRQMAPPRKGWAPTTLWDALRIVHEQVKANPALKERSKHAYGDVIESLEPGKAGGVPIAPITRLTKPDVEAWWQRTCKLYSPARANYQLLFFRRALAAAKEIAPAELAVNLKPVPVPRTRLKLITREQFAALVRAVGSLPGVGRPAAEWIEFVAYTGTRPEEANAVTWEHVHREAGYVSITGDATGTKNYEVRRVPITDALADLLARIERRTGGAGRVLSVRNPGKSIKTGCAAIGIPNMRRYDFRHLFATRCNESGVDIPTIAGWLGHRDGGGLVMKTYVHVQSDHEKRSAAKVKF